MPSNNSTELAAGSKYGRLTVVKLSHKDNRWRRHYLCLCECGTEKIVQAGLLKSGNTKSCGCLSRESKARRLPDNRNDVNQIILGYKRHAEAKGREFSLTYEQVKEIIEKPCTYCGVSHSNKKRDYVYNGMDRYDNAKGYIYGNVLPCCIICNRAKGNMQPVEFFDWLKRASAIVDQWGRLL